MKPHLRSVLIAYAVAALALIVVWALTTETVVLVVLGVVAAFALLQTFFLARGGPSTDVIHRHAEAEADARRGHMPPERPRGI